MPFPVKNLSTVKISIQMGTAVCLPVFFSSKYKNLSMPTFNTISRIVWKAFAERRSVGDIKFPAALLTT